MLPLLIVAIGLGTVLVALVIQRHFRRLRGLAGGLLVSYTTILLLLLAGELYFRFIYTESVGQIAAARWMEQHWQVNSLGFRDREWHAADWVGKTTIVVLGDSFAAGWGIENPADRFPDQLARLLGDGYYVFNLAVSGTSTPQQLETLQRFTLTTPNIVILQYFLNDIDYASLTLGLGILEDQPPPLARESALANFIYTRSSGEGLGQHYWEWEYANYDNFAIWDVHETELGALVDYAKQIEARLIVVIFPNLHDVVRSIAYVDRVAQAFERRGVTEIVKLFDAAAAWNPQTLTVSPRDGHPSAGFHRFVAEEIARRFFTPPRLEKTPSVPYNRKP